MLFIIFCIIVLSALLCLIILHQTIFINVGICLSIIGVILIIAGIILLPESIVIYLIALGIFLIICGLFFIFKIIITVPSIIGLILIGISILLIALTLGNNKNDSLLWAWGYNYYGQLGNGTNVPSYVPVQVSNISKIEKASGGAYHSIALDENGNVWAWGNNDYGQLGDGTNTASNVPIEVTAISNIVTIANGWNHNLALDENGNVWAWGENWLGQLGNGSTTDSNVPILVPGLPKIKDVACGQYHSLALDENGNVWAWGYNYYGTMGNNTSSTRQTTPVQTSNITNIVQIAGGSTHSFALQEDGTMWTWGNDELGQLGDGTNNTSYIPVETISIPNVTSISSGGYHCLALDEDCIIWAWGYNIWGALGDGTNVYFRNYPDEVINLSNASAIKGGQYQSYALDENGIVWAWGDNGTGQLGDGTTTNRNTPGQVSNLSDIIGIGSGTNHGLAIQQTTIDSTIIVIFISLLFIIGFILLFI